MRAFLKSAVLLLVIALITSSAMAVAHCADLADKGSSILSLASHAHEDDSDCSIHENAANANLKTDQTDRKVSGTPDERPASPIGAALAMPVEVQLFSLTISSPPASPLALSSVLRI